MLRALAVAYAVMLLAAPASALAQGFRPAEVELHERQAPAVGAITTAEIGEAVAISEKFLSVPAVRLLEPLRSKSAFGNAVLLQPGLYDFVGENSKGRFFQARGLIKLSGLGITDNWDGGGVFVPLNGGPAGAYWVNGLGGRHVGEVAGGAKIEHVAASDQEFDGFRRELIYTGASGGSVRLTYREFVNSMARPAFTQDLSFDLSPGVEIGYKGARLKVIGAGGTSIEYELLKPLSGE